MRLFWVTELHFLEYTNVLHAHSHLAMLGWGFTVICALFVHFLKDLIRTPRVYQWLLLANALVCLAMTLAFIQNGYTVLSISLLSAHLLLAYILGYLLLKDLSKLSNITAILLGRWAVYWMFISTVGVWVLPLVVANFGKLDPLYLASIEFFLHFQFNGWFVYAVLALLVLALERRGVKLDFRKWHFLGLQFSLVLTYGLPLYWSYPLVILNFMNALGVTIQLLVLFSVIYSMFKKFSNSQARKTSMGEWLIMLGLVSLMIKVVIQFTLLLPSFLVASLDIRHFFIGFIHLLMLGVFTMTSLGVCIEEKIIVQNNLSKLGLLMLVLGFVSTEVILFAQGILLWNSLDSIPSYNLLMLLFTLLLPLAIGFILASLLKNSPKPRPEICT